MRTKTTKKRNNVELAQQCAALVPHLKALLAGIDAILKQHARRTRS